MNEETQPVRYLLEASSSRFTVQAFARGLLAGFGHNPTLQIRDFAGEVVCVPGTLAQSSLHLIVRADSVTVIDEVSAKDRREIEHTVQTEVLEAAQFPQIEFQSTESMAQRTGENRYRVRLTGALSLRGLTRQQVVEARVTFQPDGLRAQGGFSLQESAFGIKPVSALGGMLKIKDGLEFTFDIFARQSVEQATNPTNQQ